MSHAAKLSAALLIPVLLAPLASGQVTTVTDHRTSEDAAPDFRFANVPPPCRNDAAEQGTFTIVTGRRDRNGGGLDKLHDGKVPVEDDQPAENFFFAAGTDGGRILLDLGRIVAVERVNTFSWHPDTRAPQVYTLFAADGTAEDFLVQPRREVDPQTRGWKQIAQVDTRGGEGRKGGQHGVSVRASDGRLGSFRYLLFDIFRTEAASPFGNTFYSEIDVVEAGVAPVAAVPATPAGRELRREVVQAEGGYEIVIDTTEAPDLTDWAREELAPVVREWYPKIVQLLPSDGYQAPRRLSITFSADMQGVAAASGTRIRCAAAWFRRNLQGEAKGAVVHELCHVVQNYGLARRRPDASPTPGWLVEGICDYIRWFLYEPETRGAEVSARNVSRARYDASYRITANFLNWVSQTYDQEIVRKLNAAAREGRYRDSLWNEATGHDLAELDRQWRASLERAIAAETAQE